MNYSRQKSARKWRGSLKPRTSGLSIGTLLFMAMFACAACATAPPMRPVSATLEIEIDGQWRRVSRVTYEYRPVDWQSMSLADLQIALRERESRGDFGPTTTALRVLVESRKAGLKPKQVGLESGDTEE